MTLIDEWMESKKKTYWRIWESTTTDYPNGTYNWVLFFTEDDHDSTYESGLGCSEEECRNEIKWAISTRLKSKNLL